MLSFYKLFCENNAKYRSYGNKCYILLFIYAFHSTIFKWRFSINRINDVAFHLWLWERFHVYLRSTVLRSESLCECIVKYVSKYEHSKKVRCHMYMSLNCRPHSFDLCWNYSVTGCHRLEMHFECHLFDKIWMVKTCEFELHETIPNIAPNGIGVQSFSFYLTAQSFAGGKYIKIYSSTSKSFSSMIETFSWNQNNFVWVRARKMPRFARKHRHCINVKLLNTLPEITDDDDDDDVGEKAPPKPATEHWISRPFAIFSSFLSVLESLKL